MTQNAKSIESHLQTHQYEIVFRDPEPILKKRLGDDLTVVDFESKPFLMAGDNYRSTMMKITVNVQRKNQDKVEKLHLVGKLLPPTDFQRTLIEGHYAFQKEIFFYEQLIPIYQDIYKKDFNIAPQYYGSRKSLELDTDKIDEDIVLLLENLKVKGYYMEDRLKGLDLKHLEVAIPAIATFHAVGLSLIHKKPTFVPILKNYTRRLAVPDLMKQAIEKMVNEIKNHSEVKKYYVQIKSLYDNSENTESLELEDPWACIVHLDLWSNNLLFHRDDEGKVDDVKFVDFQTFTINSPLIDLIHLLCNSMEYPMEHFDAMLELYREKAYKVLEELNVDASFFEKRNFEERLKRDATTELLHTMIVAYVVEYRQGDDFMNRPANDFVFRRWKRICEIFEQKKWF